MGKANLHPSEAKRRQSHILCIVEPIFWRAGPLQESAAFWVGAHGRRMVGGASVASTTADNVHNASQFPTAAPTCHCFFSLDIWNLKFMETISNIFLYFSSSFSLLRKSQKELKHGPNIPLYNISEMLCVSHSSSSRLKKYISLY